MPARQRAVGASIAPGGALAAASLALLLAMVLLVGASVPALAVEDEVPDPDEAEEEEPPPDIEELCAEGTIAEEFCPDTYEEPSWFQWLTYPLLIIGLVMVALMLIAYLTWQPRFAKEHEEKMKSRR